MKFTGERVVPTDMHKNVDTYQQHLARYVWVLDKVVNKIVTDAACGTGYGTNLISLVAHKVKGFDISKDAINYAIYQKYKGTFHELDLENLPFNSLVSPGYEDTDVVVSFETIEHLNDPKKFLEWCKATAPVVIGSIPINCPTDYHKHVWSTPQIIQLVSSIFPRVTFWLQEEMNIKKIYSDCTATSGMILFQGER